MSYQVLARKWRPKKFSELMGQGHVVQALSGSLAQGRLHHAFLFTGTRGVGKTTIARIIAKALNCEAGLSAEPCGVCSTCLDIDQGRYPDLLEIDAASRTKVDDTREILDNVLYAPSRGRFKVYLIDEVHMLSLSSFNALLKTLEEPPEHVKFILATTDPQKLPVTVLSRCLKFHLKRLTPGQIAQQMTHILQAEAISADAEAIDEIARAADGSMRDGLSLLDQAIAYGQGELRAEATREMLGTISRDSVLDLIEALAHNDADALIAKLAELNQFGGHHGQILARVTEAFHTLAFLQITGEAGHAALEPHPRLVAMAHMFDKAALQVNFQLAILGAKDVQMAPEPRLAFEMCMLRMLCFAPVDSQPISQRKPAGPLLARAGTVSQNTGNSAGPAPALSAPFREPIANTLATAPATSPSIAHASEQPATLLSKPQSTLDSCLLGNNEAAVSKNLAEENDVINEQSIVHSSGNLTGAPANNSDTNAAIFNPQNVDQSVPVALNITPETDPDLGIEAVTLANTEQQARWCAEALLLDLKGPPRELAHNLALERWDGDRLLLSLDSAHAVLSSNINQLALAQAWQQLGHTSTLAIELRERAPNSQTPAQFELARQQLRQHTFESSVREHPLIASLGRELGAVIRTGSMVLH